MLSHRAVRKGKRQRFYARNAVNTTLPWRLGVLMRSFSPAAANSHYTIRIHAALTSFADEVCATLARLFAYVGTLALLGILGVHFWDLWEAAPRARGAAGQGELERGQPLLSGPCRQLARSVRENRGLYHPSESRRRPQGHFPMGRQGRKAAR